MNDLSSLHSFSPPDLDNAPDGAETLAPSSGMNNGAIATPVMLKFALVDTHNLTRECLLAALGDAYLGSTLVGFSSVDECVADDDGGFDLIIYYAHESEASLQGASRLRLAHESTRLVVLSDLEEARQLAKIRETLVNGADGFVSTQTTSLAMTIAAIRFVQSGGTYVPTAILLSERTTSAATPPIIRSPRQLTVRQGDVMEQLQLGKANKIIAFDLGMSESTVKVHVRNIMRKMGATNRTQAAFAGYRQTSGTTANQWASA
jgi:DNA-binding NarL/FixJ family response regulator